jgi:hypothetical protein
MKTLETPQLWAVVDQEMEDREFCNDRHDKEIPVREDW